jgi:hypothetical protein
VSFTEILEELPKLTQEQRRAIYRQIEELDGAPLFEATDEMLAAIDEGTRSAETEPFYTAEELRTRVRQWASSSSE